MSVTLLGPQRPVANLPAVLAGLGSRRPVALVSAGWRYDEDRDEPLRAELGRTVHNLRLYDAYTELEREAPDLARAHARKQSELLRTKASYRLALGPALAACRALWAERQDPRCPFFRAAVRHLQEVDRLFLDEAARLHAAFDAEARPAHHPMVRATVARVRDILAGSCAVLIAGGHVGILRNRLAFYGVVPLLAELPIFAWSAGAMVLGERVLLYHDRTPGDARAPEFLDLGFGLVPGAVLLPHARARLDLDTPANVGLLAARLAPLRGVALHQGAVLDGALRDHGPRGAAGVLTEDGALAPLEAADAARP